jgi:hypothetical protein
MFGGEKMVVIKRKKKSDVANKTEMTNLQLEFHRIKEQRKLLEKREKEVKGRLDEYMSKAFEPDSKGHYLFTTVDENGNNIHLQKQARKKISLNEDRAFAYLIENGLEEAIVEKEVIAEEVTQDQIIEVLLQHASHLVDKKTSVDESTLEQMVTSEKIPMSDFEELCDINITYAMTFIDDKKLQQEGEEDATKGRREKV